MNIRETNTSMFLVPGLGFDVQQIRSLHGFINGYIRDSGCLGEYDNAIFMLFKPESLEIFESFVVQEAKRTRDLLEDYDYDGGFVVLVYQFPVQYLPEYKLFLHGKYSRFRKRYIDKLPRIIFEPRPDGSIKPELGLAYMACTKSEKLKAYWQERLSVPDINGQVNMGDLDLDEKDEYWLKPRLERETLYIEKLKHFFADDKNQRP